MATTPIHVARPHELLKRLPTALVVSVGLLAVTTVPLDGWRITLSQETFATGYTDHSDCSALATV